MTKNIYLILFTIATLSCTNFFYAMDKKTELGRTTQKTVDSITQLSINIDNTIKTTESINKSILAILESLKKQQQNS